MNQVTRIADDYFIVRELDKVIGVAVKLDNGCYVPYVDGYPVLALANFDALLDYLDTNRASVFDTRIMNAKHASDTTTQTLAAV